MCCCCSFYECVCGSCRFNKVITIERIPSLSSIFHLFMGERRRRRRGEHAVYHSKLSTLYTIVWEFEVRDGGDLTVQIGKDIFTDRMYRPVSTRSKKRHNGLLAELHGHLRNTGKLVEKEKKDR